MLKSAFVTSDDFIEIRQIFEFYEVVKRLKTLHF
jgi:hypothetical protein